MKSQVLEQLKEISKTTFHNTDNIVNFIGDTNNAENLTGNLVENMNNYIRCYPERVEVIESKKQPSVQIDLF